MQSEKNKILIVEDEPQMLNILNDTLSAEGFDVLLAKDGEEGIDIALKEKPDLILLDVIMPNMNGITMLKKLREDDWGKHVGVIMLSNLSSDEAVSESIDQNVHGYLIKTDWKLSDLIKLIRKKLKNKQS